MQISILFVQSNKYFLFLTCNYALQPTLEVSPVEQTHKPGNGGSIFFLLVMM